MVPDFITRPSRGVDMRVHFAGTRGSAPVTRPDRSVFGGDTTCLLVTGASGEQVVLDCGSGLANLAPHLGAAPKLTILLTHFHLDHLVGLMAFPPLYDPASRLLVAAPPAGGVGVGEALRGLFRAPYWPVDLDRSGAGLHFTDLPTASNSETMRVGGLAIRWTPLPHPGGCTAYRLDEATTGASLVLATDAEWDGAPEEQRRSFLRLCREPSPCGLLVCDGQYDDDVAGTRRGWGHSSVSTAVALAREAGCERLFLTHHDPGDDDTILAAREAALLEALPGAALARQGQELDLARKDPS
jgi:ribonuclease BN (tRNA processing enzyme)